MFAVNGLDRSVWEWMIEHRSAPLTRFFSAATTLCNGLTVVVITALVGLALLGFRHRATAVRLVATVSGAWLTATGLKLLVGRARPPIADRLITVGEYSFPSGHATQSIALWTSLVLAALAVMATRARPSLAVRGALYVLAAAFALVIGVSRLYLGVHWFTDVLGGWTLGATWCVMCWRRRPFGVELFAPGSRALPSPPAAR